LDKRAQMGKPLALITGASSGIGAAFARRLSQGGYRLILVARREERLRQMERELGDVEVLVADLADEADLKNVEGRIRDEYVLDLIVNGAGFGTTGFFFSTDVESQISMHRLHVFAAMRLTHAALGSMVERRKGAIINVSSVAGFNQSAGNVSYCATKAWMNSFSEGLYLELKMAGSPVQVQALCPGFTFSEFHDVMGVDRRKIPGFLWMTAEDVVAASLDALATGKLFVVPGAWYKFLTALGSAVPRSARLAASLAYSRRLRRF
jgi:short-subunit dehydrogenase